MLMASTLAALQAIRNDHEKGVLTDDFGYQCNQSGF